MTGKACPAAYGFLAVPIEGEPKADAEAMIEQSVRTVLGSGRSRLGDAARPDGSSRAATPSGTLEG